MSRERDRITKKLEKNPAQECNKIQQKFYPELFSKFDQITDPRHSSYIDYSSKVMLGTMYYKGIAGISSMQGMTREFNDEIVAKNLYRFMGSNTKKYLPHAVTVNEFLERLDPVELEKIQSDIVNRMIRRKTFDDAKVLGKWLVLIDGTELDEGNTKKNENYLSRCYNRGKENEFTKYYRSVLEAKIYLGNDLVCSMATETIENSAEYNEKKLSEEEIKQDCESKAFVRIAAKIKKRFPRLPVCIVADSLYVSEKVLQLCRDNRWDYIIRYKEVPHRWKRNIRQSRRKIKQEKRNISMGSSLGDRDVNVLKFTETKIRKGKPVTTEYAWITSMEIKDKNAQRLVKAGRCRWKIENHGFNRQKRWQGDIEHACSFHERAQKNHYLMEQISDFMKQLYEYFFLKKNEIRKVQKNISSELLASFGRQLTETEDIPVKLNETVLN
ncbi:MAG: transposase family protein [Lachnospiraceae bacterium]|nr:transposase family protein [Lachnospiraceae bacterium]